MTQTKHHQAVIGNEALSISTLAALGEMFTTLATQANQERQALILSHEQREAMLNQRFSQLSERLDSAVRTNSELKTQLESAKADNSMLVTTNETLRSRVAALEPEATAKAPAQAPAKKPGSKPVALSTMPGAQGSSGSADVADLEVPPLGEVGQ